jgi:hypothetical protein
LGFEKFAFANGHTGMNSKNGQQRLLREDIKA